MARPKANTEAGRIATEKWRKTMIEKYGSEEAFKHAIRCMGSLGGRKKGIKKGFALNPKLASKVGAKGGKISRRTGVSTGQGKRKEYFYNGGSDDFLHTKPLEEYLHSTKPEPEPKKKSFIQRVFGGR